MTMEPMKNQSLYEKCKKIVKKWEFDFTARKGRVPSKMDIRDADKNIRDAYRTYFRLKTEVLMDVINFENEPENTSEVCDKNESLSEIYDKNDVSGICDKNNSISDLELDEGKTMEENKQIWGKHLNKQEEVAKKTETKTEKVISSFTKKLFNNSKFMKRNPRSRSSLNLSSRSFSADNSQNSNSIAETLSQPTQKIADCESNEKIFSNFNCTLPITSDCKKSFSQPVTLIDQVLKNSFTLPTRKVDQGWLQRLSINTGTSIVDNNVKEISESNIVFSENDKSLCMNTELSNKESEIISDSDEDESLSYHVMKRRKLSNNSISQKSPPIRQDFSNLFSDGNIKPNVFDSQPNNKINSVLENIVHKEVNLQNIVTSENIEHKEKNTQNNLVNKLENKKEIDIPKENNSDNDYSPKKKSVRKGRKIVKDSESEDEQPKKVTRKRKRNQKVAKKSPKTPVQRKTRGKKAIEKNPIETKPIEKEEPIQEYVREYSVKPPPNTVPRIKKLPVKIPAKTQTNKEIKIIKEPTKKDIAENKLRKKIASGTLNENFVRIDIQKKVYVRGKKKMNFSKYKKNMYKNKQKALCGPEMDMGGCDGGVLTCFKCGKTGHFARQCKAPVDRLLPLEADEEVCPYPSLEEATEMARQSVLAVHKPNISSQTEKQDTELADVVDSENIDHSQKDSVNNDSGDGATNDEFEFEDDEELESFMMNNDIESMKSLQPPTQSWEDLDEEKFVKPLYNLNSDSSLQDTPNEIFKALYKFGHKSFRPGQEQAIMRILSGKSTLVTLSTGSGKSLCYQLPAYLYAQRSHCISLIISPLVSLMDDQVSGMPAFLKAACLHTMQTGTQKEKVMKLIESGELNILLVSPEAVTAGEKMSGFGSLLRKLPPIAFACIDEAHCVSQWSHNFRPSYLMICHVLRERLGIRTILGLTATSTYATSSSIIHHLQIPDGPKGIISDIPLPDNLHLSASYDQMRDQALKNLITSEPYSNYNSIIVYCTRREECERIASYLRTSIRNAKKPTEILKKYKSLHPVAEPYHAGLVSSRRRTVQNAFMESHLRIVVATVAFGMGINKSDIRAVIHYNMPSSFESYVQEVGRSGRDGLPANCHVFLNHEGRDLNELKRHIYANSIDRHVIRKLLQKIFVLCNCTKTCPRHEVAFSIQETVQYLDVPEENISTLLCYLELHEKRLIEVLTPAYTMCKIIAYGGKQYIIKGSADCPPLAMALALHKMKEGEKDDNFFEFPVVDVASAMGWDSGIVKHKLKNLEWVIENNQSKRSKLSVQFSNLGFRLRAPGNLSPFELDETLDSLYAKVKSQEQTKLCQLQVVHSTLTSIAEPFYRNCLTEDYGSKSTKLKVNIREYFSSTEPLKDVKIIDKGECCESQIISDTRCLVGMYRDNNFTGRAVARIFHGIQSPNYPAVIWGRCKFWRSHLHVDFNKVCTIATAEILKLR